MTPFNFSNSDYPFLPTQIYEVDPLTCPKCKNEMRILAFIEDQEVIKKILKHLGLWEIRARPPPRATGAAKNPEYHIDYSTSQLPEPARRSLGGSDNYLYVDSQYLYEA